MIKIIFVRKGNMHRSPIAERLFKKELAKRDYKESIRVESYALHGFILEPTKGRCLMDYSTEYKLSKPHLDSKGIDMTNHYAAPLSDGIIDATDLILTMHPTVHKTLLERRPHCTKKTFLFTDVCAQKVTLPDVDGSTDPKLYENVISNIELCVVVGFEKIIALAKSLKKRTSSLKAVLFDLDKTLHAPSKELIHEVRNNIDKFLQRKALSHNYEESIALLETIQNHYASIELGLDILFGIPPKELSQAMFANICPEKFVKKDTKLVNELQKLNIKKAIFNGATKNYCNAVLSSLGILTFFDHIFTAENVPAVKSSVTALRFIANELSLRPQEILYVGDNFVQDILPAKLAGFQTLHVTPNLFENHKVLEVLNEKLRGRK